LFTVTAGSAPPPDVLFPVRDCEPVPLIAIVVLPPPPVTELLAVEILPVTFIVPLLSVIACDPAYESEPETVIVLVLVIVNVAAPPVGANDRMLNVVPPVLLTVNVEVAVKESVPLLCVNDPLLMVKFDDAESVALVDVKAVPEIVNAPEAVMFEEPPVNVPALNVAPLLPIVIVFAPCVKVPG